MDEYDDLGHLQIEVRDDVAVVTFAPVEDTSLHRSFFNDLHDVLTPLGRDPAVRAVVFTGGVETFTPHLKPVMSRLLAEATFSEVAELFTTIQRFASQLLTFRKPTVAAVSGPALNFGGDVAFLCDAIVASTTATFGDSHLRSGLTAGDGGTMFWPLVLGIPRSREILFHGREIIAAEALELHLVLEVVEPERTLAAAVACAQRLMALPPVSFMATKLALNNAFRFMGTVTWDLAAAYEAADLYLSARSK